MNERVIQTTHLLPAPWMAESDRVALAARARTQFEAQGGRVVKERLMHNTAFDKPGEKTTTEFTVEWRPK